MMMGCRTLIPEPDILSLRERAYGVMRKALNAVGVTEVAYTETKRHKSELGGSFSAFDYYIELIATGDTA